MNSLWVLLVVLGVCRDVFGWGFLWPTSPEEGGHISFQLTNNDGGGYNFPYTFTIYRNNTGQDEQVNLQYVTATPFYWDNNQPAGTFLKFHIQDVNGFVSTSRYVQVVVNPTSVSLSVQSTASVASVREQTTSNTPTQSPTTAPSSTRTPTTIPVRAIAGGVVGGVFVLAAIMVGICLILRRRRRNDLSEKVNLNDSAPHIVVTPFTYDTNNILPSGSNPTHTGYSGHTSYGGPSSYAPSEAYAGQNDAPPIYSAPPSEGSSNFIRGFSQRKGVYAPTVSL